MNDLISFSDWQGKFSKAIEAINQPRTGYVLRNFVINQHFTPGQQWAQCVLEQKNTAANIERARIMGRKTERHIEMLEAEADEQPYDIAAKKREDARDDAALARIDLWEQRQAELGAKREFLELDAIRESFGREWTREELDAEQPEYWQQRINCQASHDVNATGRVGVGNQDAFRMMGMPCPGAAPDYIEAVQQRMLSSGKFRVLTAVPTMIDREVIKRDSLRCLDGWDVPGYIEQKIYVVQGKPVADAYNDAALTAMQDGADFVLCVEDDNIIPPGSFERLYELWKQAGPKTIVGAWYAKKMEPRTGVPIVIRDGRREPLDDDGAVHEVYVVPQGFTLIPVKAFHDIARPWFATTGNLSQDSFFSQLAREAGYKLLVDTGCRIKHVCRETGRVYE